MRSLIRMTQSTPFILIISFLWIGFIGFWLSVGIDTRPSYDMSQHGGTQLTLEMDTQTLMKEWLRKHRREIRTNLRRIERITHNSYVSDENIIVRIQKPEDLEMAKKILAEKIVQSASDQKLFAMQIRQDGLINLTPLPEIREKHISKAINQTVDIIKRRLASIRSKPLIEARNKSRILVQIAGYQNLKALKNLLRRGQLTFQLVDLRVPIKNLETARVPFDSKRVWGENNGVKTPYIVKKRIVVSGDHVIDAQPSFDQHTNEPVLTFRLNPLGAQRFSEVTHNNVGKPFAIIFDDKVLAAPHISEPITAGSAQINGNLSNEDIAELAIILRSGTFPAPFKIIQERIFSPNSNGAE